MNRTNILNKVKELHTLYQQGKIPRLAEHEVFPELDISSRENYLYFTMSVCLNFQRNSPALWKAALATWNDPATNYVFFPELVVTYSSEKVQSDLLKHKLAIQTNKHPHIWIAISKTLHELYQNDPREFIEANDSSVTKIIHSLQGQDKRNFPYLSGPKLSNYWLYILTQFTDIKLKDAHMISIIPDTHVQQASFELGLTEPDAAPDKVSLVWKELLLGSDLTPADLHPVLWNWSRNNFQPLVSDL